MAEQEQQEGSAAESARQDEEEVEEAKQVMSDLEDGDPPEKLEYWPGGKAKLRRGRDLQARPVMLRHHEHGAVTIEGES